MATGAGGDPPAWAKTIIDDGMNKVEAATTSNPPGATVYNVVTVMPDEDDADYDGSRKWTPAAAKLLLSNFEMRQDEFNDPHVKNKKLWEEVAQILAQQGHNFDSQQCEQKWRNLKSMYHKTVIHNESGRAPRKCMFYGQLHRIFGSSETTFIDYTSNAGIGVKRIRSDNVESPFTAPPPVKQVSRLDTGEFQVLDTGQEARFNQYMDMAERQHKEKMTSLNEILHCLKKK